MIYINKITQNKTDQKYLRRSEARLASKLKGIFNKQLKWLDDKLKELTYFQTNSIDKEIEVMIDNMPYQEEFFATISAGMATVLNASGKKTVRNMKMIQLGIRWNMKDPQALDWLKKHGTFHKLSQYRGEITNTTKKRIQEIVAKGVEENLTYTQLSKRIMLEGKAGVFSKARGELIAIQELGQSYKQGSKIAIDNLISRYPSRTVVKRWITVSDSRVRPTHKQNQDDGWILYQQNFSGTGEQLAPSKDFRCRCTFTERLLAPNEELLNGKIINK